MREIEATYQDKSGYEDQILTIETIMKMEFSENEWLVEKLVPFQGITIISGAPGSYKTWLIWQMAINIAEGSMFLEQFACSQSAILVIDEENHLRQVKKRLHKLSADATLPIHFLTQQDFSALDNDAVSEVIRICKKNDINTIFIDSLVRISNSDENNAQEMSRVFKAIKHFCQAGKTVIMTHHERKEGTNKGSAQARLRGSSDISAAIDCHLSIKKSQKSNKIISVEQPKLRIDEEIEPFVISVINEGDLVKFQYEGAPVNEKVYEIKSLIFDILSQPENEAGLSKKVTIEKVRESMQIGEKAVKDTLDEFIKEGVILTKNGVKKEIICFLAVTEPSELPSDPLKS